ncbi:hypothetical protein HYX17_04945 [Candidatus Woesearchaeota archaeon]|nr:hypothetical protein [Candidatus Woesearchaeota archaeon]
MEKLGKFAKRYLDRKAYENKAEKLEELGEIKSYSKKLLIRGEAVSKFEEAGDYRLKSKDPEKAVIDYKKAIDTLHTIETNAETIKDFNDWLRRLEGKERRLSKLVKGEWKGLQGLESKTAVVVVALSFGLSLVFSSISITGFAVASSSNLSASSWIGLLFFVIGLIVSFFYLRE